MKSVDSNKSNKPSPFVEKANHPLRIWLFVAVVEGIGALLLFFKIPGDSDVAWLIGFSKARLGILVGLLGCLFFLFYLIYRTLKYPMWMAHIANRLQAVLRSRVAYSLCILILFLGMSFFTQMYYFSGVVGDPYVKGYLSRLRPLLFWISGLLLQTLVLLPLFRYGFQRRENPLSNKIIRKSGLIIICLLIVMIFIAITGIGIDPDIVGWDGPGTPLLFIQVGAIWVAGIFFMVIETWSRNWQKGYPIRLDLLVSVFLWGFAYLLWVQEPLTADYFAPAPGPPNYEIYPYSDAALHDVNAQELLIGEGFAGISRKPLYVMFLALLHTIVGQNYHDVITLQVGILALLPVLIYWLTKGLHHRLSGFIAAGLIILRERNAISLSGEIRVSHSKLLMSDMPAVLAIVLLTWMITTWLKEPHRRRMFPIWIGGVLGLLMLLRPQFSLLILLIPLMILIYFFRKPLIGIGNFGLVILGLLLTLSPWLWRSYRLSGAFTLNDPSQMAFLTEQYHLNPQTESLQLSPGETISAFNKRINNYISDFILENPRYVTGFIASHFLHNEIEMIQVLPMSPWVINNPDSNLFSHWSQNRQKLWTDCCSVQAYVDAYQYWDPWLKQIDLSQFLPIIIHLILISIGLATAWHSSNFIGWFPLLISLTYSFSTAIGRYSGWRLILPADWVILLYFSIGLAQGIFWLRHYYKNEPVVDDTIRHSWVNDKALQQPMKFPWRKSILVILVLFGFGLMPLAVEAAVPKRYQADSSVEDLSREFPHFSVGDIREFLAQEGATVVNGRALYPRFLRAREGEPGESWTAFLVREYPRIGFFMVGAYKGNVILPLESSPDWFPHAADVIVLGCLTDSYLDAAAIKVRAQDNHEDVLLNRDPFGSLHCPLPSP